MLGLEVSADEQAAILVKFGFEQADGGFRVPTWRARDVTREIDLVEEVARFKMEEIPFTLPERDAMFGRLTRWQRLRRLVEDVLTGCGFSEAYTSTFVADGDVRLPEPLSQEAAALRTALIGSLVDAARHNVAVGTSEVALFEIARTYRAGGELPDERWHVAGIVDGGFAEAKWAVEQLYDALKVEPDVRARRRAAPPSRKVGAHEGGLGRRAAPVAPRGNVGSVRARSRRARRGGAGGGRVRRGEPVPGGAAGSRVRRRRGRAGGGAARRAPRGGRSRAPVVGDLRRVSRRADRRRQAVARLSGRVRLAGAHAHRRRGRRSSAARIVQALADTFGAVLRA